MLRYLLRRALLLVLTLLITSAFIFALTQLLPGDVPRLILGRDARPEAIAQLRSDLGLDLPAVEQYVNWLTGFVVGDWGVSFANARAPVQPLVTERLGYSLLLAGLTLLISVPLSIGLGIFAGLYENTWIDSLISVLTLSVVGVPEFVTSLVLINGLALGLGWFPATSTLRGATTLLEALPQLILPAISATFVLMAYVVRMTRAGMIDELKKLYVRTAVLKGLPWRVVIVKHVLRNALLPTITVIALSFGWLIGGIIVIENVFNYPGLGRLLVTAVERKDIPLMQAVVMVIVFFIALANVAADVIYALLNPRIRLE